MALRVPVSSRQYVRYPIKATVGGQPYDPSADPVAFAFVVSGDPVTYYVGSWESDTSTSPTTYLARCIIGPGAVAALAAGTYSVYVKVTPAGGAEIPVIPCGTLEVY